MDLTKFLNLAGMLAFSLAFFAPSAAAALPADFSKMYVFGDSLSDTGNVALMPNGPALLSGRYEAGRFTNGAAWVDGVANAVGINPAHLVPSLSAQASPANFAANYSINFAYGGAATGVENTTPDGLFHVRGLLGQAADFGALAAQAGGLSDAAHSLFTVWAGANDYLLAGAPGTGIPSPPVVADVVANVRDSIQSLYADGARNFIVPTLPDMGNVPIIAALGGPAAQAYYTALGQAHNALLEQTLYALMRMDPGIKFYSPDIFGLYDSVQSNPSAFGFGHSLTDFGPATGCLLLPPHDCSALGTGFNGEGYATWDEEHPSAAMHGLIADRALAAGALVPEPATWALFLAGGGALAARRRRRA